MPTVLRLSVSVGDAVRVLVFGKDRSRDTGGVGLGLAIARHALQAHAGQIRVRNVDPGLEVEIRLPNDPESANTALSAAS